MICAVIKVENYLSAYQEIREAALTAEMIELRLDYLLHLDFSEIKRLREECKVAVIITLRSNKEGGHYKGSEKTRLKMLLKLAALNPDYLDIEHHVSKPFIKAIANKHPTIGIIISYHNFTNMPKNLNKIYKALQRHKAHYYKIAATAKSSLDALRLLCFSKSKNPNLIAVSMGSIGQFGRIIAHHMGSPITYAILSEEKKTAPGQLTIEELTKQYRYSSFNSIYALIGDPIDLSISHITHNQTFEKLGLFAVYIKIALKENEIKTFLTYVKKLPFKGLSVTMPLKEAIIPYLDEIDDEAKAIGAINTLVIQNHKIIGFNTDGKGALDAIQQSFNLETAVRDAKLAQDLELESLCSGAGHSQVAKDRLTANDSGSRDCVKLASPTDVFRFNTSSTLNKRILVLGGGGAAKAIMYEAKKRGAVVYTMLRDPLKAKELQSKYGYAAFAFNLETAVRDGKLMQDLELESLCNGVGHSQMVKDHPIANDSGSRDCVKLPSPTAVSRFNDPNIDIVVNCTPVDFEEFAPQMQTAIDAMIENKALFMDIKTKPKDSILLTKAKTNGCPIVYGHQMFALQAALQFKLWTKSSTTP